MLLVKIFEHQGCYGEVVKILDSENLGLDSRVVQNEWSFVGTKLFNLEKAQMWTEALAYTRSLLAIPTNESERKALQERDDWAVWQILIAAARNINTKEFVAKLKVVATKKLTHIVGPLQRRRNFWMILSNRNLNHVMPSWLVSISLIPSSRPGT